MALALSPGLLFPLPERQDRPNTNKQVNDVDTLSTAMESRTNPTARTRAPAKKTEPSSAAATRDTSSSEQKPRLPRTRSSLWLSAQSGREPQAKRPAGTPEGPAISAANEKVERTTPPLPPHQQRAVAPKNAGVRGQSEVLDGSGGMPKAVLVDAVNKKSRAAEESAAKSTEGQQPRQIERPQHNNVAISSGNWSFSGRVSDAFEELWGTEMDEFIAPARTLEVAGGDDEGWVVVFGSDESEKLAKPAQVLLTMLLRHAKSSQRT
ncbi:hypothetical protein B0T16DRAFT_244524 [Cercophora newfieldiana]|uniref:Uncharacterized protein n=1 Tax=Cercophora newfieldiana TaxID=92897 RepID=A0AA40CI94_9PEZI|nr:hypothetical protein B0T16DRAFT_244524 [Cercophora newfieldiana]